eukprot:376544-Prymnesium_polylepis.1
MPRTGGCVSRAAAGATCRVLPPGGLARRDGPVRGGLDSRALRTHGAVGQQPSPTRASPERDGRAVHRALQPNPTRVPLSSTEEGCPPGPPRAHSPRSLPRPPERASAAPQPLREPFAPSLRSF